MKQTLIPNKGISTSLLWIMAIISGVTVANLYFNQPVLNMISTELGISSLTANWLPIITQLGYAAGLLFIIPLGDLVQVRKILTVNFTLLAISLLATALTSNIYTLLFTSFIIGAGSVTVNGVSLTVVSPTRDSFKVAIIPYTKEHTNFCAIELGSVVNLEFDIIGKYIARINSLA